jgi:hypothetical protein
MQVPKLQEEITALEFQIDYLEKRLDIALKSDLQLAESKKLLHEIRTLRTKLDQLAKQNKEAS